MKRGQLVIAIVAAIAVAAVAVLASGGGGGGDGEEADGLRSDAAPKGALRIPFAYSPEKEKLLTPLIREFNQEDGQAFVVGQVVSSGEAETKIAEDRLRPVIWSPASSLWGRLLNFDADRPYAPDDNPSIVRTPLVIAMWEPMARALGYPRKPVGFKDVLDLASSNQGWAKYGKPQYGKFKLVHTNPDFSTAGLSAVVAEYYAATGKKEGLTAGDISNGASRK